MALVEELEADGNWLFKWRSYLPLTLLVAALALVPFKGGAGGEAAQPHEWWEWVCLAVSALGLLIRAATIGCAPKGTSGRNTGQQVAHRLNSSGLYSVVRHPLYLAYAISHLGYFVNHPSTDNGLVVMATFLFQYLRILSEERFLSGDPDYAAFMRRTRWQVVPYVL